MLERISKEYESKLDAIEKQYAGEYYATKRENCSKLSEQYLKLIIELDKEYGYAEDFKPMGIDPEKPLPALTRELDYGIRPIRYFGIEATSRINENGHVEHGLYHVFEVYDPEKNETELRYIDIYEQPSYVKCNGIKEVRLCGSNLDKTVTKWCYEIFDPCDPEIEIGSDRWFPLDLDPQPENPYDELETYFLAMQVASDYML